MTCKDCIHYEVCMDYTTLSESEVAQNFDKTELLCDHFKHKSRFVDLPCEVGQTVWRTSGNYCGQEIYEGVVDQISITKDGKILFWVYGHPLAFDVESIGKTVFLSREEAEKALAERSK